MASTWTLGVAFSVRSELSVLGTGLEPDFKLAGPSWAGARRWCRIGAITGRVYIRRTGNAIGVILLELLQRLVETDDEPFPGCDGRWDRAGDTRHPQRLRFRSLVSRRAAAP